MATNATSMCPTLEAAAARRLAMLALTVAGVTGALRSFELIAGADGVLPTAVRWLLLAISVSTSIGLFLAIRWGLVGTRRALYIGPYYEVMQGLLLAISYHASSLAPGVVNRGWTPIAVWALVYPLIVPASGRRVVLATCLTAATDPTGMWVNVLAGASAPTVNGAAALFLPTAIVCVAAPVLAQIVYGLAIEVTEAKEMGSYRLVERLGEGGMGEVWRAEHRMLVRPAALKLIRPDYLGVDAASRAAAIRRFTKEARATATLRSPHTVSVYDFGVTDDGAFFYVMELLEGVTLDELIRQRGPLNPELTVYLLRQVCHSLEEAHAAGMVHRDIKPENIFVCRVGSSTNFIKLLDFGLVKDVNTTDSIAGLLIGTPQYLAPELATGRSEADCRSDIYSLGCVAYWLLTGRNVFTADSTVGTLLAHVHAKPVPLRERTPAPIPMALESIVMDCLEKRPERRPQTVGALEERLKQSLGIACDPGDWLGLHESLAQR